MKAPVFLLTLPLSLALNLVFWLIPTPGWLIAGMVVFIIGASITKPSTARSIARMSAQAFASCAARVANVGVLAQAAPRALTQNFCVISGWSNPLVNLCTKFLLWIDAINSEGLEPT